MQQLAEAEAELDELVSRKKNVDKELVCFIFFVCWFVCLFGFVAI